MAWRLVLCLFGHLTLLFFLAVYLISSLNSVRLYTPVAHAQELQIESLNIIPALLGAMDAERRVLQKKQRSTRPDSLSAMPRCGGTKSRFADDASDPAQRTGEPPARAGSEVDFRGGRLRGESASGQADRHRQAQWRQRSPAQSNFGGYQPGPHGGKAQVVQPADAGSERSQWARLANVGAGRGRQLLHHSHSARPGQLDHRPHSDAGRCRAANAER